MGQMCREYLLRRAAGVKPPIRGRPQSRTLAEKLFAHEADAWRTCEQEGSIPDCFGEHWAAATSAPCGRCRLQVRCLHRRSFAGDYQRASRSRDRAVLRQFYALIADGRDSPAVRPQGQAASSHPMHGSPDFARRWLAERERNPIIAQLTEGQILERTYKGQAVRVRVGRGFYEYAGQEYPTLYAVTLAATGLRDTASRERGRRRSHAWSAKRFFFDAIHRTAAATL